MNAETTLKEMLDRQFEIRKGDYSLYYRKKWKEYVIIFPNRETMLSWKDSTSSILFQHVLEFGADLDAALVVWNKIT